MSSETLFEYDLDDPDTEFLNAMADTETPEVTNETDSEFTEAPKETARARAYRKRVSQAMANVWKPMLASPNTIDDAAAILQYGPGIAMATGDLADRDEKARKVVDFILDGTDNPYLNLAAVSIPLVIQLMRNHEEKIIPTVREIKIPFTKFKFKVNFGIRLGKWRNLSHEPRELTRHVLFNPKIQMALQKQGIQVAWSDATAGSNGTRK